MHLVVVVTSQILVGKVHLLIVLTMYLFYILIVLLNLGCGGLMNLQQDTVVFTMLKMHGI